MRVRLEMFSVDLEGIMSRTRLYVYSILFLIAIAVLSLNVRAENAPVVNINTATVEELCYLPGVGLVIAQRIVDARPFPDTSKLLDVKGIGEKKYAVMLPHVVVNGTTTATEKIKSPKAK